MATATQQAPTTSFVTGLGRMSYVNVFKPAKMDDDETPKYSLQFLIDKSDKVTLKKINAAVTAAIEQGIEKKWGGKKPAKLKLPLRDGDEERPDDEAYAGKFFFTAKSKTKPGIVDKERQEILDETELVSGDYGRIHITIYPYEQKGVAVALNHVQLLKKGEPLGASRQSAEEAFDDDFDVDDLDDIL